jgi:hypothetical protein
MNEFSNFFNIFCRLLVLLRPEHSSSSTDTQPALKCESHSKMTVRRKKMFSKSFTKYFKGFGSGFIELHAKLDADTLYKLPSITSKRKHEVEKALM